jgi:multiple sugar transport system substrate-binding protein
MAGCVTRSKMKIVPILLLAIMMFASLAACGKGSSTPQANMSGASSSSGGQVNLTFWSWVTGIDKSVALFNQTHPNIHVKLENVGSGPNEYNKLYTAIKANNEPDLAQVEFQLLPTFETTGSLIDLSQYGANAVKDQFVPWTWQQVSLGNSVYAIPQDSGPLAMYYREDVFKKYNISVPTTWAEYADAAEKLHAANPNVYITDFPPKEPGWYTGLIWQAGGQLFGIDGDAWKVSLNNPSAQKVSTYWQNLIGKNLVKTEPDFANGWYHDLQTGNVATWISAAWGAGTIQSNAPQSAGQWRVAPIPQWEQGQTANGNWGGSTSVVFNNTKHPKEAAEFAIWLNTNEQSIDYMIKGNNIFPAHRASLDSPLINGPISFFGNQNIGAVFKAGSEQVNVNFQWGPTINQVYNDIGDNFAAVVNRQSTLNEALDSVQEGTVIFMRGQGFTVTT